MTDVQGYSDLKVMFSYTVNIYWPWFTIRFLIVAVCLIRKGPCAWLGDGVSATICHNLSAITDTSPTPPTHAQERRSLLTAIRYQIHDRRSLLIDAATPSLVQSLSKQLVRNDSVGMDLSYCGQFGSRECSSLPFRFRSVGDVSSGGKELGGWNLWQGRLKKVAVLTLSPSQNKQATALTCSFGWC